MIRAGDLHLYSGAMDLQSYSLESRAPPRGDCACSPFFVGGAPSRRFVGEAPPHALCDAQTNAAYQVKLSLRCSSLREAIIGARLRHHAESISHNVFDRGSAKSKPVPHHLVGRTGKSMRRARPWLEGSGIVKQQFDSTKHCRTDQGALISPRRRGQRQEAWEYPPSDPRPCRGWRDRGRYAGAWPKKPTLRRWAIYHLSRQTLAI